MRIIVQSIEFRHPALKTFHEPSNPIRLLHSHKNIQWFVHVRVVHSSVAMNTRTSFTAPEMVAEAVDVIASRCCIMLL